jgi:hypothetical protein
VPHRQWIINVSQYRRDALFVTYLQRLFTIVFAAPFSPKKAAFAEAFTLSL